MPRGTAKTDEQKLEVIEVQLSELETRKGKIQNSITELNSQKKQILSSIRAKKLDELSKVLDEAGKTPDDVLRMLNT